MTRPRRTPRRRKTSPRRSVPMSGGCMSAPIIIGRRCSTAATIRRSRTSIRPASRISARTASCSTSPAGRDNPATPYIGAAIREECGLTADIQTISEVPSRSLLSRLTDHYLQIIANRAPIGFEAEFVNQRGDNDLLSRHLDAVFVRRRHDRLHLWRDQLEGRRRVAGRDPADRADASRRSPSRSSSKRLPSLTRLPPASTAPAPQPTCWEDGPLAEADDRNDDEDEFPKSRSMPTPASPIGCGPRAKPPRRSSRPTDAPAPRSIARLAWPMISPSPPSASRRIMPNCSRNRG